MIESYLPVWLPLQRPDSLPDGQVDLWKIHLEAFHPRAIDLAQNLSSDEIERGRRFVFDKDRFDFLVGRSVLRALLSQYLGVAPADVKIETAARGKPRLSQPYANKGLRFNIAHSYGLSVMGFRTGGEIGVDLEKLRQEIAFVEIAERFFAPREATWLRGLPPHRQCAEFFLMWTRKEAISKAIGEGLHLPLDQIPVESDRPFSLRTGEERLGGGQWRLHSFVPEGCYAGSLATEGEESVKVRYLEYRDN